MKRKINYKNLILNIFLGILSFFFFFLASVYDVINKKPSQIWDTIFNYDSNNYTHISIIHRMLILSAMVLSIVALSVAGLILQTTSRNPLASPGVMGIMGSIKMGATLLSFVGITYSLITKQLFLMFFAAVPIIIIFLVIKFSKIKLSGLSMIFIGISLGVIFSSIEWFIMYNNNEGSLFITTFLGSNFSLVNKNNLMILSFFVLVPILVSLLLSKKFTLLSAGDDMSAAAGNNANKIRILGFILVIIMVPASIILGGNLLFAGIIAPNIAKILIKNNKFLPTLIATIFIGIILMMITSIISSFIPVHIGSLLNVIAAPVFILIARRSND